MPRADLLALDAESLAVLANRGLVRRALSELTSSQYTCELADTAGTVTVRWSDPVECVFPAGKTIREARCSCPATALCRHILRSVFAYQRTAVDGRTASGERQAANGDEPPAPSRAGEQAPPPQTDPSLRPFVQEQADRLVPAPLPRPSVREQESHPTDREHVNGNRATSPAAPLPGSPAAEQPGEVQPWDPGTIPDAEIAKAYRSTVLARIRSTYEQGHVLELARTQRPTARIRTLSCTVRFLVPGDLRYTRCDCAERAPCSHVPLAIWAFRALPDDQPGGLISTRRDPLPVPEPVLDALETALTEWAIVGVSNTPSILTDRLRRLEEEARNEGLVWPAEIVADLLVQHRAYADRNAQFHPPRIPELAGELAVRIAAIRANTGGAPPLFVRGSSADRTTEVGAARLVGIGCGATLRRGQVEVTACMQDISTGSVIALSRAFADPPADTGQDPEDLWRLAGRPVLNGFSLSALGAGQMLTRGGKRTAAGVFLPPRTLASVSCSPQAYRWEALHGPLLVEDLAELEARLAGQLPSCLSPRRITENLVVCPVAGVRQAGFSAPQQVVYAVIVDTRGNVGHLLHPYTTRGRAGAEAMLQRLTADGEALRFVAARVQRAVAGVRLAPVGLVFEEGSTRTLVQPWVERPTAAAEVSDPAVAPGGSSAARDPLAEFLSELGDLLGEQWLLGLERRDERLVHNWRALLDRGGALGFHRLLAPIRVFCSLLEARRHIVQWQPMPAARALVELSLVVRAAAEEVALV